MDMTPVQSSNVVSVGYDLETKTLAVQFKSGDLYHYDGVSPESHRALMASPSKGGFLAHSIIPLHKASRQEPKPVPESAS